MAFISGAVVEQRPGGFDHNLFSVSFGAEGLEPVNADAVAPAEKRSYYPPTNQSTPSSRYAWLSCNPN